MRNNKKEYSAVFNSVRLLTSMNHSRSTASIHRRCILLVTENFVK